MPVFVVFLVHISHIRTEYGDLRSIQSKWGKMRTKKKLRLRTLFTQCVWKWFLVYKLRTSHSAEVMTSSVVSFCLLTSVWKLNLIPYAEVDNLSATMPQPYLYKNSTYTRLCSFNYIYSAISVVFQLSLKPINIPVLCKKFSWQKRVWKLSAMIKFHVV